MAGVRTLSARIASDSPPETLTRRQIGYSFFLKRLLLRVNIKTGPWSLLSVQVMEQHLEYEVAFLQPSDVHILESLNLGG